ncbi:cation-transporting ATPase [Podospora appendiculata]|uniref:Cation-transporting ATPase n=1 Tax=Podospora appendiculata TaxID=314037 RepID=A0AAE1C7Q0_9PEZI|nr:cation-transporting ATPase [Podospora appendiculata]
MLDKKDLEALRIIDGIRGLERGLVTDGKNGLQMNLTVDERRNAFSSNRLPNKKTKTLIQLLGDNLTDPVVQPFLGIAGFSIGLGIYRKLDGTDGRGDFASGGVVIAIVMIGAVIQAVTEWQKEKVFALLVKKSDDRMVTAIRFGEKIKISVHDVLVGDLLELAPGDLVPADGVLVCSSFLQCDESSLTGESEQVAKVGANKTLETFENGQDSASAGPDPFIISGSKILAGTGRYLVTGVGVNSIHGRVKMESTNSTEETPLQKTLTALTKHIAISGAFVSAWLGLILGVQLYVHDGPRSWKHDKLIEIALICLAINLIAIPEGLPLAVALAHSNASHRMLQDGILVRKFTACETMGNATTVLVDKTGTLTMNRMSVVTGALGTTGRFQNKKARFSKNVQIYGNAGADADTRDGEEVDADGPPVMLTQPFIESISSEVQEILVRSIAINSTAFKQPGEHDGQLPVYCGSQTEAAMLRFAEGRLGMISSIAARAKSIVVAEFPFDSAKKCMATVTKEAVNGRSPRYRMYIKGAPEFLLEKSISILGDPTEPVQMRIEDLTPARRDMMLNVIKDYASQSLRTLGLACRDFGTWPPVDSDLPLGEAGDRIFINAVQDLTFLGVMGIQDTLRPDVRASVEGCIRAGVSVKMVTGDNVNTAMAVARECGILTDRDLVMEGREFRALSSEEMDRVLPKLQVLARFSPEDKKLAVVKLKELGETVAVTGDGTNDGPALAAADVGFALASGTDIAKEAASIVLLDDSFSSIVKAILWGRMVHDAVKMFLQFHLTANFTTIFITCVSVVASGTLDAILTPAQLLWVNLIMEALGALVFACECARPCVLLRRPERKSAFLFSLQNIKMTVGQAIYQLAVVLTLNFGGEALGYVSFDERKVLKTLIFNTIVWLQLCNMWNNRRLDNNLNIFEGVSRNPCLLPVTYGIIICQISIMMFGGETLSITPLSVKEWAVSLLLGFMTLPVGVLIRLFPAEFIWKCVVSPKSALDQMRHGIAAFFRVGRGLGGHGPSALERGILSSDDEQGPLLGESSVDTADANVSGTGNSSSNPEHTPLNSNIDEEVIVAMG